MPRQRVGTAYVHGVTVLRRGKKTPANDGVSHWDIQATLPGGGRSKPVCMPLGTSEEAARDKALRLTQLAAKGDGRRAPRGGPLPPPIVPWPATPGVYFAASGERVKIGTAENIAQRLRVGQTFAPRALELLAVVPGAEREEAELHWRFARDLVRGEWFNMSPAIVEFVRAVRFAGQV